MSTERFSGRTRLFNGRDLSGWQMVGEGNFVVEGGALKAQGGMGLLWYTRSKFGNVRLRTVYRVSRVEDNSGVFVRIADRPPDPWYAVHHGYEVQILATGDEWHRTGCIYSMTSAQADAQKPPGEWNILDIAMQGERIEVTLNGIQATTFDPSLPVPPRRFPYEPERGPRPEYGYIGLQNHDADSVVYFREVSVEPLE
ncbi:MAG: hypothetical protein A2148_02850 [Chloroflexi bacterium RBG_16_68_14]|nr:MAG: hypothetical protein A2148_02850 [Chloroflexi bacterium RBG_16_68_14]